MISGVKTNGISLTMRSSMTSIQTVSVFHALMEDPRAKDTKKAYMYQQRAMPFSPTGTLECAVSNSAADFP